MPISKIAFCLSGAALTWSLAGAGAASENIAPRAVSIAEDFVVLGAPGYCADVEKTDLIHDPKVILFGSCAALRGNAFLAEPFHPAVVTVAITELGEARPSVTALEDYLQSNDGRAKLSRSGDPDTVQILRTRRQDGIVMLHATDRSPGAAPGMLDDIWRAVMTMQGRLISISMLSFADDPMSSDLAFSMLRAQCDRIRRANLG